MLREDIESDMPLGRLGGEDEDCASLLHAAMFLPVDTGAHRFGIAAFGGRIDGETYSGSDLEVLGLLASQTALAMENAHFQKELRSKQEIERELEVAKKLQRRLLPHTSPEIPGVELTAAMLPCHEVGGDYFDYLWHSGETLSFAIGDVSGKGILMANVQAVFRAEADGIRTPDQVLARMNRRLLEIEQPDRFVSFFAAQLDPRSGELHYSNAGHPPPVWIRSDGTVRSLKEGGLLLGIQPAVTYPLGHEWLRQGDVILCYTDGIADPDADGSSLREDELESLARENRHLTVDALLDRILERIRATGPLEDDTTVLVLKCVGDHSP
jgi:serine phosphatase RsbU (regulator of sigma subunit)